MESVAAPGIICGDDGALKALYECPGLKANDNSDGASKAKNEEGPGSEISGPDEVTEIGNIEGEAREARDKGSMVRIASNETRCILNKWGTSHAW